MIKKDSVASIETEGLLGNKYLAVSFGSQTAESVKDGDSIESRPPFDYAELAQDLGALIVTIKEAVDSSKIAIGNINEANRVGAFLPSNPFGLAVIVAQTGVKARSIS